jgi:hypothetical protein
VSGLHDAANELNGRGVSGGLRCSHRLHGMFSGSERHQICGRHDEWILHDSAVLDVITLVVIMDVSIVDLVLIARLTSVCILILGRR